MVYKDPFLGDIILKKLSVFRNSALGEDIVEVIYTDDRGNFYIDTQLLFGNPSPMTVISKDLLIRLIEAKNLNTT